MKIALTYSDYQRMPARLREDLRIIQRGIAYRETDAGRIAVDNAAKLRERFGRKK